VVLVRGPGLFGSAIRAVTASQWNHVALLYREDAGQTWDVLEAMGGGVSATISASTTRRGMSTRFGTRAYQSPEAQAALAAAMLPYLDKTGYDYLALAGDFFSSILHWRMAAFLGAGKTRVVCSEYARASTGRLSASPQQVPGVELHPR